MLSKFFRPRVIIATHNNSFHPDDIFACATLLEYFSKKGRRVKVVRSRDEKVHTRADVVFDTGDIYDPSKNRFDHHQPEGAGTRENGIPYASCGLIWKHFGKELCNNNENVWQIVDQTIMQGIDAGDNGMMTFEVPQKKFPYPYLTGDALASFRPTSQESFSYDEQFMKAVSTAREFLVREIVHAKATEIINEKIFNNYQNTHDKRILLLDEAFSREEVNKAFIMRDMPETIFAVFKTSGHEKNVWKVLGIRKDNERYETKKPMPASWAGLRDGELATVTGVPDAIFCHRGLFMAVAETREGAIMLAQKALDA